MDSVFFEAYAPGRMDVMGGIADYSGSLVLQMPISKGTRVRIKLRDDYLCVVNSETSTGEHLTGKIDFQTLLNNQAVDYSFAHSYFSKDPANHWMAYVLGCVLVLQKEKNIPFKGAAFEIKSDVPLGKGVSSSASLEVATMKALGKAFHISFAGTELPRLAQMVENQIVGAACGLMDQLASFFGKPNQLLPIICQPDNILESIDIPDDVLFMGIDSGIRHSVGGASYSDVRCAAFMGYSIIMQHLGFKQTDIEEAKLKKDFSHLPYDGYLCNITVADFERNFSSVIPENIVGLDFLKKYKATLDEVTKVNSTSLYAVYNCTSHPIYENERVMQFKKGLENLKDLFMPHRYELLKSMGNLMYQSHESYSRCGLGSERTDEIVALAKGNEAKGILGAKITGGGSGGTVCILAQGEQGRVAVKQLHLQLCEKYKTDLVLFTSP